MARTPEHVYVGFGSNIGDRLSYFERSRKLITESGYRILRSSGLYETDPWGGAEGGPFLNAVFEIERAGSPMQLLLSLQQIESELNRTREKHFGARTCDLDILLWGGEIVNSEPLRIPHARLTERRFVLTPLCDLIPDLRHPELIQSFRDLLRVVSDSFQVRAFRTETRMNPS